MRTDARELLCESCGYPLAGLEAGRLCPECGRPASESDPANRPGSRWQRGPAAGSWLGAGVAVLRRPRTFWDRVIPSAGSGRGLAAAHAVATAFFGVGLLAFVHRDPGLFAVLVPAVAAVVWTLTLIEVTGVRFWGGVHGFRITKDVAWAVCGHAAVGWTLGGLIAAAGWIAGGLSLFGGGSGALGFTVAPWASLALIGLGGVAGLMIFETLTYVGIRRMRFANHPAAGGSSSGEADSGGDVSAEGAGSGAASAPAVEASAGSRKS